MIERVEVDNDERDECIKRGDSFYWRTDKVRVFRYWRQGQKCKWAQLETKVEEAL